MKKKHKQKNLELEHILGNIEICFDVELYEDALSDLEDAKRIIEKELIKYNKRYG